MNLPTIHQLRKAGYKLKIEHYRRVLLDSELRHAQRAGINPAESTDLRTWPMPVTRKDKKARAFAYIHPKGGSTNIWLVGQDGQPHCATASCRNTERFNRRLGLRICLGRLVKAGAIPAAL